MLRWLITTLVDSGWVKTGLFFGRFIGTINLMHSLTNDKDIEIIKKRYQLIESSGFFSGEQELSHKQAFIKSLFTYDAYETDAYSKALESFYSWNGGNINPLKNLFNFIKETFFQGIHTQELKQTFIEATFAQNNGESNTLAHTAWPGTKSTQVEEHPLDLLLNTLDEAGCFMGSKAVENQQQFITALSIPNKNGENALCQAVQHKKFGSELNELSEMMPNFQLIMDKVQTSHCIDQGEFAQKNKEILINGLLHQGKLRQVLGEAMLVPKAIDFIFKFLEQADYFSKDENKQTFFDKLVACDQLHRSALYFASRNAKSLQLVCNQLKSLTCFEGPAASANKEKMRKAILNKGSDGKNALSEANGNQEIIGLQLQLLEEADCFKNTKSQQEFINAILAADEYGMNCLYHLYFRKESKLAAQLKTIKFLEGPNAEANKANFITAVLSKNTLNGESALCANYSDGGFNFLLEHLTLAGCFSGPNSAKYKQKFIDAVFSKDIHNKNIISRIYHPNSIILLLQKLTEAGCFTSETNKKAFINAVKTDSNALVFHCMRNINAYLELRKSLKEAGFSTQELKDLLNQSVTDQYGLKVKETPYMVALKNGDEVLIEQLKKDGAELTNEQATEILEHQGQNAEEPVSAPKELDEPNKGQQFKPTLERRASFSGIHSGIPFFDKFNEKAGRAQDDSCLVKKSTMF